MDFEEKKEAAMTPRSQGKQKSLKKLGTFVKSKLSKKNSNSERTAASLDDSEDGALTGAKKLGSMKDRLKKRFSNKESEEEANPHRRSFSAADLADLSTLKQETQQQQQQTNDDDATESVTQSEESVVKNSASQDRPVHYHQESFEYPQTPVPSQDEPDRLRSVETRSSSNDDAVLEVEKAVVVGVEQEEENAAAAAVVASLSQGSPEEAEEEEEEEQEEVSDDVTKTHDASPGMQTVEESTGDDSTAVPIVKDEVEDEEQKQGIQILDVASPPLPGQEKKSLDEVSADAAATIDVGIEETVAASFNKRADAAVEVEGEERHEEKIEEEIVKVAEKEEEKIKDAATAAVEQMIAKDEAKPLNEAPVENVAKTIKTRDIDLSGMIPAPAAAKAESSTAATTTKAAVAAPPKKQKQQTKPKTQQQQPSTQDKSLKKGKDGKAVKRRPRRFKLRTASFSLAGIAVGLLFLVLKAKH